MNLSADAKDMIESAETIASLYAKFLACGSLSTDSRRVAPGSLFFALRGEAFDGNRFAAAALESGAAYAVVDDPAAADGTDRFVVVGDTLTALQQLAARHRAALGIPVLAITGTNGKTTTKELISRVLSHKFRIGVTEGNLNNHIGVPLTLLAMRPDMQFGIVEMGAGAPGEIALLCRIAQPNYGVITNIGMAHLEGFGDFEGVRRGKGELFDYLAHNGGVAFYRSEDPVLSGMAAVREGMHAIGYSESQGDIPNHLEGDYNRYNIAAAAAIGEYFEVPREEIMQAVASYRPDNNRSQVVVTEHNRLIADCYNANPSSMRAAIANFARGGDPAGKIAILGDMLELGEWTAREHAAILDLVAGAGFGEVFLVGRYFRKAAEAQCRGGFDPRTFDDAKALAAYLESNPPAGKAILLKGSRGMRLESLIGLL